MDLAAFHLLSATEAARLIRDGILSSEQLVDACLARIREIDPQVEAWAFLDPDHALAQARADDTLRLSGQPIGALHGVPVAIKDIFDTADMPTECGSPIYAGRTPSRDATVVVKLRAAGAVIIGKTVTTEFAYFSPGKTRNPHDTERTPGGSSSGSAAAVAAGMVPLAVGSQTNGSLIRPGSFCGVYAMKPTWNAVSAEGVKLISTTLDTVGWYGRSVADLALLADAFALQDDDPSSFQTVAGARILIDATAYKADAASRDALAQAAQRLEAAGAVAVRRDLAEIFTPLDGIWEIVSRSEGRTAFLNLARLYSHLLHEEFMRRANNVGGFTRSDLVHAYDTAATYRVRFDRIAGDFDAVLTLSAPGEAPEGRVQGDNSLNRDLTLLHVPCINIPAGLGPNRMPVGLTLTGPRYRDRHLLTVAAGIAPAIDCDRVP